MIWQSSILAQRQNLISSHGLWMHRILWKHTPKFHHCSAGWELCENKEGASQSNGLRFGGCRRTSGWGRPADRTWIPNNTCVDWWHHALLLFSQEPPSYLGTYFFFLNKMCVREEHWGGSKMAVFWCLLSSLLNVDGCCLFWPELNEVSRQMFDWPT